MASRSDTKTRILDIAEGLMQRLGYNAFSYQHISSQLGIKNAAIHYYFPSKEHLGADIIRRNRERFHALVNRWQTGVDCWAQLDGFIEVYQTNLHEDNKVCLIAIAASAYYTLPASVKKEALALASEILTWLTKLLETGRISGDFHFEGPAHYKAAATASSLTGALQLARICGNEHFYHIIAQIKTDLKTSI